MKHETLHHPHPTEEIEVKLIAAGSRLFLAHSGSIRSAEKKIEEDDDLM